MSLNYFDWMTAHTRRVNATIQEQKAMSLYDAVSDWDYYDRGRVGGVQRTCVQCQHPFPMALSEEYVLQPVCDRCVKATINRETERVRR